MNSRISQGYWIWGQFDINSTKIITSLYQQISNKLNGPKFDLHLTISGPFNYNEGTQTKIFEDLSSNLSKINLQLNGIKHTGDFYRSMFIDVAENKNLNNLKNAIDESFDIDPVEYLPHISLFYGIEDVAIKNEIIKKLKTPKTVSLDKLSIVKVDEEIKSWKVLKSYPLFKHKQSPWSSGDRF